jgi:hypothetical protein
MTDVDVVQWLFDTEKFTTGMNWPVSVAGFVQAKRSLDSLVAGKASAGDVLQAYELVAGSLGPTVMNGLLESDDAFPEVNHSGKPTPPAGGKVTLYVDPEGRRVVAECTKEWGMPPKITVE